jgi:hypothetical protein
VRARFITICRDSRRLLPSDKRFRSQTRGAPNQIEAFWLLLRSRFAGAGLLFQCVLNELQSLHASLLPRDLTDAVLEMKLKRRAAQNQRSEERQPSLASQVSELTLGFCRNYTSGHIYPNRVGPIVGCRFLSNYLIVRLDIRFAARTCHTPLLSFANVRHMGRCPVQAAFRFTVDFLRTVQMAA